MDSLKPSYVSEGMVGGSHRPIEQGGKELEDPCYLCWKDLETTEEQDFNRTELENRCNLFWKKILTQTELDFHIGSIHRKIPVSRCSCYRDVQDNRCDLCDNNRKNGDSLYIYRTLATYVGGYLRLKLN